MTETFDDAFAAAETRAPKVTEVPAGKTVYVVKGFNIKDVERDGQQQQEVGIRMYFPKYGISEWANYGHKAAGVLKSALKNIGVDVNTGLKSSLEAAVGRFGDLEKSFSVPKTEGAKAYPRYSFLNGEVGESKEPEIPF